MKKVFILMYLVLLILFNNIIKIKVEASDFLFDNEIVISDTSDVAPLAEVYAYPLYIQERNDDSINVVPNHHETIEYTTGALWWKKYYKVQYYLMSGYDYIIHLKNLSGTYHFDPEVTGEGSSLSISLSDTVIVSDTSTFELSRELGFNVAIDEIAEIVANMGHTRSFSKTYTVSSTVSSSYNNITREGFYSIDSVLYAQCVMIKRSVKDSESASYEVLDTSYVLEYLTQEPTHEIFRTDTAH